MVQQRELKREDKDVLYFVLFYFSSSSSEMFKLSCQTNYNIPSNYATNGLLLKDQENRTPSELIKLASHCGWLPAFTLLARVDSIHKVLGERVGERVLIPTEPLIIKPQIDNCSLSIFISFSGVDHYERKSKNYGILYIK